MTVVDDLYLSIGNQTIWGWETIRLTRGIERCPTDFDVTMTEKIAFNLNPVTVHPGDECQIQFGNDIVMTGYVNRFVPSISADTHTVQAAGRGKCQDLVDCSAVWPNGQISGTSAAALASNLAAYYGIEVRCDVKDLIRIPQFNVFIGETPFEIIERVSRYSQLLVYDEPDGNLRLARLNDTVHAAGGVIQGKNVQAASIAYSDEERFSDYGCFAQSVNSFSDAGVGNQVIAWANDPGVKRKRERLIVAEIQQGFLDLVQLRANWERNRRAGRSAVVSVTIDSWRDAAGALWTPNTLVRVELPALHLDSEDWLIAEVTYRRSLEMGTTCDLVIMHPDAFQPEPIAILPTFVNGADFSQNYR